MEDWERIAKTPLSTKLPLYQSKIQDSYWEFEEAGADRITLKVLRSQVLVVGQFGERQEVHKHYISPVRLRHRWPWNITNHN